MTLASLFVDGPLWFWLHNGRPDRLYAAELRQHAIDTLELGSRTTAWLHKDRGGVSEVTGYHPAAEWPPRLVELLERLRTRTPGKGPRLRAVK